MPTLPPLAAAHPRGVAVPLPARPVDLRQSEVEVCVRVPAEWEDRHVGVVGLQARDAQSRLQATRWTEGQVTGDNLIYDPAAHTLTFHYRPSTPDVNEQGYTEDGFDPSQVKSIQLTVAREGAQDAPASQVELLSSRIVEGQPVQEPADVRPLLKEKSAERPARPLVSGVSRFYNYGDLHQWPAVAATSDGALAAQEKQDLHAFRLMGGLDLRHQSLSPDVFAAMRQFLDQARAHHQDRLVFALLDGAIPNPTLQRACQDEASRHQLVESLRPFVREFGNATVDGRPVVFDLVNEIHGTPGTERAKQQLVHELVELFVQEAPGAHLTVGVQNYRELRYWSHLLDAYKDRPVHFLMSFHLWEEADHLPPASRLNLPEGTEIAITEADPNANPRSLVQTARRQGYDWLLFWTDAAHPYRPEDHKEALEARSGCFLAG